MKTKTLFYMALTAVMTILAACSQDDELMDAAPKQAQIEFEITDGGYGGDEATRAKEEGFRTKFEAGDECGLYIIDNGEFKASNVKLTAEEGENGEITWKAADGAISGVTENSKYFLYYPYVSYADSRVGKALGDKDTEVFKELIANWSVYHIQSTYTSYTQSDLMTATGTPSPETDDKLKVSFRLTHRMALAIIEVPRTVYKFTDISIPDYVPTLVDFTVGDNFLLPYRMADGTYRCIVNPIEETYSDRCITGTITGNKKFTIPSEKLKGIDKEKYTRFVVGGGAVTEINHNLQVGDYLMKDGSLISKGTFLTDEQKANVAAIVFWAGDATAKDKTLKADHSGCTHGLAVAVNGDGQTSWQDADAPVQSWLNANRSGVYLNVLTEGFNLQHQVNNIQGYNNTKAIEDYNKNNTNFQVCAVEEEIVAYRTSHPAPANSSNWYLPSAKELSIICGKDVTENIFGKTVGTANRDVINTSLQNVSGATQLGGATDNNYYYLSSTEGSGGVVMVRFSNGLTTVGRKVSLDGNYVRPVLAF